jgi:hypothetical protein
MIDQGRGYDTRLRHQSELVQVRAVVCGVVVQCGVGSRDPCLGELRSLVRS